MRHRRRGLLFAPLLWMGCLPYSLGTTAHTTPVGERQTHAVNSIVIGGRGNYKEGDRERNVSMTADAELRVGVTEEADVGVRITTLSGFVFNYKRRLTRSNDPDEPATAVMFGAGVVNGGYHGLVETAFLWTAARSGELMPYGGVKAMQVIPIHIDAVHDTPSIGALFGLRIGDGDSYLAPEIGLYWDKSALKDRSTNWLIVPAVAVRNLRFPSSFGSWRWR